MIGNITLVLLQLYDFYHPDSYGADGILPTALTHCLCSTAGDVERSSKNIASACVMKLVRANQHGGHSRRRIL